MMLDSQKQKAHRLLLNNSSSNFDDDSNTFCRGIHYCHFGLFDSRYIYYLRRYLCFWNIRISDEALKNEQFSKNKLTFLRIEENRTELIFCLPGKVRNQITPTDSGPYQGIDLFSFLALIFQSIFTPLIYFIPKGRIINHRYESISGIN